ncbi:MAG: hypothetical protein LBQ68_00560 [Clostridiales bacterium]|jgi:hypothetical protein|nr:hypothetical protein [Clostridiales bacterium]
MERQTAGKPLSKHNETDEALIYCGPSIGRVLKQNAVFIGVLPQNVLDVVKKHPCIKKLLVPASQLATINMALITPGTVENMWFVRISREMANEVANGSNMEVK